jgi:enoyl-CoA hydratase
MNSFKLEIQAHIAHLSINRPEKSNSLLEASWYEMKEIFIELDRNPDVRVIVLSGEGKHFCAGMDLNVLLDLQHKNTSSCEASKRDTIRQFILDIQACITQIEKCRKPVLAAIHGGCIGGAVDIVTACDIRYATEDAYFTIKEIDLGIVADIGTLQRLPTIIHPGIAAEMAYTARKVYGTEAAQIGLVNAAFVNREAMMAHVHDIAHSIACKSPVCVRGTKEMLLYKRDHTVVDSLYNMANYNAAMLLSDDLTESFMAQMQKRPAVYK